MRKMCLVKFFLMLIMVCVTSTAFPLKVSIHPEIIVDQNQEIDAPSPPAYPAQPDSVPQYSSHSWRNWDSHYRRHYAHNAPYYWTYWNESMLVPKHTVIGSDLNHIPYYPNYVCQASFGREVFPGKIWQGSCYITSDGRQVRVQDGFRILVSHNYDWVPAEFGEIPRGAIVGGEDADGQPFYICRGIYKGEKHPGKIVGQNCSFAYAEEDINTPYYDVLVY